MVRDKDIVQAELIIEYFKNHPNKDISHPEIVDWVVAEYNKRTGKVFRDPDRAIRMLSQQGMLIKIKKGVYKYDPDFVKDRKLKDFTPEQKETIFKRDGYKCVECGRGLKDGVEIHADHIKPRDFGGESTIENGQTWNDGKGVLGIYIHNLKDVDGNQATKGRNPFEDFTMKRDNQKLSSIVKAYDPPYSTSTYVYDYIKDNVKSWVEEAISIRENY